MRNLKKVLALVLALVMAMSLVTIANASDFTDASEITYDEAVDVMTAIGVIDGLDTGAFNPTGTLTREQAAKIIATMMLGDGADKLGSTSSSFTDVAVTRWSSPYIEYCVSSGIIAGVGNNQFNPTGKLTGYAFAKMLLVALGYEADREGYVGTGWSIEVAKDAVTAGITVDGVSMSAQLTREQAAQMAFQTLTADTVKYEQAGTTVITPDGTQVITGGSTASKVTAAKNSGGTYDGYLADDNDEFVQFCETYFSKLTVDTDGVDGLKRPANVWSYDNETVGTYGKTASKTLVVADANMNVQDILGSSDYFNYSATKYSALADTDAHLNGSTSMNLDETNSGETADVLQKGDVVEVFLKDNKVDTVVVLRYSLALIDSVDDELSTTEKNNDATYAIDLEEMDGTSLGTYYDDHKTASKVLNGFSADTYKEGTALAIVANGSSILDSYVCEVISGVPTAARNGAKVSSTVYKSGYIKMDGTQYDFAGTMADSSVDTGFSFENDYTVYATKEGYAIGIDGTAVASLDDVYYVTGVYMTTSSKGTVSYYAEAVSLKDGSKKDIQLESATATTILKDSGSSDNYLYTADGSIGGKVTDNKVANIKENTLYVTANSLYTFTDKADKGGKSGDGKYDAVAYVGADAYAFTKTAINDASGVKKSDTRMTVDSASLTGATGSSITRFYMNSSTTYLAIESFGDNLNVATNVGGMKAADNTEVIVVVADDDTKAAVYVVYVGADLDASTVVEDNLVYLAKQPVEAVADGYNATLYFMADGSSEDVVVEDDYTAGFYSYEVEDNVYTLGSPSGEISSAVTDDTDGYKAGLSITSIYNNMLTAANFDDINFANAVVIDARSSDDIDADKYNKEITSAARLADARDKGTVTASVYVENGEITFICVTDCENA